jgi:hypothetical protein
MVELGLLPPDPPELPFWPPPCPLLPPIVGPLFVQALMQNMPITSMQAK